MPAKTGKSELFAKFGDRLKTSFEAHKNDEVKTGIIKLPGGIVNGVAQLDQCYFKSENGKMWFRAVGVVVSPEYVGSNGSMVPIKNLHTSVMFMIGDETFDKDIADVMNCIKALAGADVFGSSDYENFEAIAAAIAQHKPFFRFSTESSKEVLYKEGPKKGQVQYAAGSKVWERWHGAIPDYNRDMTPAPGVRDNTVSKTPPTKNESKNKPVVSEEHKVEYRDDEDIDSLITRADKGGDDGARSRLIEMCGQLGYSEDDFNEAAWATISTWLKTGESKANPEPEKSDDVFVPEAGQTMCKYSPPDPKKEGKRLKEIDCEVTEVDEDKGTMTLKGLTGNKKSYPGVSYNPLDEHVKFDL